ncbi:MAG TPA: LysR substrate-binding domain-containing protein [Gammaproteobacteria bacterium]|nr:LysR substrate-binding domain-containing protein [Gammaproteobacteria bacterium]
MSLQLQQPYRAAALLNHILIHEGNRKGWREWFAQARVDYDGTTIDDANLVLQTALNGQGVAPGILPFVEGDLLSGKLTRLLALSIDPGLSCYLIYRKKDLDRPAVESVRDWLLANIEDSCA